MKTRTVLFTSVFAMTAAVSAAANAQAKDEKKPEAAKPAAPAHGTPAKPADKPAEKPAAGAMPPEMDAIMKAAQPGDAHARLKPLEGNWDALIKSWMDPNTPTESKGLSERKWILDGRFLQETHTGDFLGMPFKGQGITGYDNVLKKYVSVWADNFGTGFMNSTGTADESGKTITYMGEYADPMTGQMSKNRMVMKIVDDKKNVFEMYGPGPDGKEFKMMEITYTKK